MLEQYYDFCIVGAGLSGCVLAEQLTGIGKKVLIVEKRAHIGGNCYDTCDSNGVLYHVYGPHYFRTNAMHVKEYLSQFTEWIPAQYIIKVYSKGRLWSFPVNLRTFEQLIGRTSSSDEFEAWVSAHRIPVSEPKNSEDIILSQIGKEFYELFFEGYTLKQWNRHPRELDASVCGRIPMRLSRDERYFSDSFQAMPRNGYTALFHNILKKCGKLLTLLLDTDYHFVKEKIKCDKTIYTGPIDRFYDYRFGPLPWRSLSFQLREFEGNDLSHSTQVPMEPGYYQEAVQINYPNDFNYTRIVEIKHVTRQDTAHTNLVYEFPLEFSPGVDPYYPIPNHESHSLYKRYASLNPTDGGLYFLGRLATYQYINMDVAVDRALSLANLFKLSV